jgi:PcfJ-like protein
MKSRQNDGVAQRARIAGKLARRQDKEKAWANKITKAQALESALSFRTFETPAEIADKWMRPGDNPTFKHLLKTVVERVPRIIQKENERAFRLLSEVDWIRPISDFHPIGKSVNTLLRGLFEHLLARYRMPSFLWSFWKVGMPDEYVFFVAHTAAGGSVYDAVREGLFPVPFTRKMCHDLMADTQSLAYAEAVRRVQVRTFGGNESLYRAILQTFLGSRIGNKIDEGFWQTVIEWFAKNPMMPATEVGPLCDYIEFRRRQDVTFSMKGRGLLALMRAKDEWHAELARHQRQTTILGRQMPARFVRSGFRECNWERKARDTRGNNVTEIWRMREILTADDLMDEGKAMRHCVYSYGHHISPNGISVWALTKQDGTGNWRQLTLEIRNSEKKIVQARGVCNRLPTSVELQMVNDWAAKNSLTVNVTGHF